jgi:hypothetical protein
VVSPVSVHSSCSLMVLIKPPRTDRVSSPLGRFVPWRCRPRWPCRSCLTPANTSLLLKPDRLTAIIQWARLAKGV